MRTRRTKGGFTLIEVLVASILLGMLTTILTMVFNQSSVAWRTGRAGIAEMSETRHHLAVSQINADRLLPRVSESSAGSVGTIVGPWDENGGVTRRRAVEQFNSGTAYIGGMPTFSSYSSGQGDPAGGRVTPWATVSGLSDMASHANENYIVGVLSYGPDGQRDTEDDITSWPGEVQ